MHYFSLLVTFVKNEPLTHFIFGALLIYGYLSHFSTASPDHPSDSKITVSKSDIENLKQSWIKQRHSNPTSTQLRGLIETQISDEIYYREALKLGLDQEDSVVRNRMIQKMKFLTDQSITEPSDAQLKKWIEDTPTKYQQDANFSFEQIYIGTTFSKQSMDAALIELNAGIITEDVFRSVWQKPLSIPKNVNSKSTSDIRRIYGDTFVKELIAQANNGSSGAWSSPLQTAFGYHLIKIDQSNRDPQSSLKSSQERALIDPKTRKAAQNDWISHKKQEAHQMAIQALKKNYDIIIVDFE
ncbi:peptidylprolyl isomerase [Arenicella sp. 4NH20-0111]|uniref:peptidylprolyl isomerase n=1 Tax=Arenicella sp. 4NH20-0111 TaxID=3127648 RepID=UPI003108E1BC